MRVTIVDKRQRGVTLMEMIVVVAISTVVMFMAYGLIDDAVRTTLFLESHNDLTIMSQKAVNTIQRDLFQAENIFSSDTVGTAYRAALVLTETPVAGTLLPRINSTGSFSPDGTTPDIATARETGNSLLISRQLPPLVLVGYDHDANAGTPTISYYADRYQFQYYYLVADTTVNFSATGSVYDVVQATSDVYADYFQLGSANLTAVQRQWICLRIAANGITRLWGPGQPVASALYDTADCTDGSFAGATPNAASIPIVSTRSILPGLKGGRISGRMFYTVGKHQTGNAPWPETEHALPKYAQWAATAPTFPSGFEVKVIGPSGLRQTAVRVMLLSHYGVSRYDSQEALAITSSRY